MQNAPVSTLRRVLGSIVLLLFVLGASVGLIAWKQASSAAAEAAAASQPEPMEAITVARAEQRLHRKTTTAVGTVLAVRSITLHNELPGTVQEVALVPGTIVEKGALLVAFDVSVESAELRAQEAQAALAETMLQRIERAVSQSAASAADVDRARAEREVAHATVARTKAIIARKTIRAPFRARVGMADIHIGQYLHEGTRITTLQGVDQAVDVDFTVTQTVAAGLRVGEPIQVVRAREEAPIVAEIVALDARVDRMTRNVAVRARLKAAEDQPIPGSSVRVQVPVGPSQQVLTVPVSALRKGPSGDHVFVVTADQDGRQRARMRVVQSSAMLGDDVVITGGLHNGDLVAAKGSFKLHDAALVSVARTGVPQSAAVGEDVRGH